MDTLDQLARQAAADLRAAVPEVSVDEPPVPRRALLAGLGVAAVVVLVATAALLLRTDDETVVADAPVSDIRLGLTPPPEGAVLFDASEGAGAEATTETWFGLWGTPGAADPFAVTDLSVNVSPLALEEATVDGPYVEVDLGGIDGRILDLPFGLGRGVMFNLDDRGVFLSTRHLSDDELVAIGEGIAIADDGTPSVDPATLPAGLEPVALVERAGQFGAGLASRPGSASTVTSWNWPARRVDFVITAVDGVDDAVELLNRYALGPGSVARTVRGRPAWQSRDGQRLLWRPAPDVLVLLQTSQALIDVDDPQLAADDVVRIAEAVGPVDAETWEGMLDAHPDADPESPSTTIAVDLDELGIPRRTNRLDAEFGDGRRGVVYLDEDGLVCALVAEADDSSHSTCVDPRGGPRVLYDGGKPFIVFGQAPDSTVQVAATIAGTERRTPTIAQDGARIWAYFLIMQGLDVAPTEVVYLDAAGDEIGRAPVTP